MPKKSAAAVAVAAPSADTASFPGRNKIARQDATFSAVEKELAAAFVDLEMNNNDMKAALRHLHFVSATELDVGDRAAVVLFVPFTELTLYHHVQQALTRELEKKLHGRHVLVVAQRKILRKPGKNNRQRRQKRPFSRTLTAVHDAVLADLVYPMDIVGKRLRVRQDGSQLLKVHLQSHQQHHYQDRLKSYAIAYKKLTGKEAVFEFPTRTP